MIYNIFKSKLTKLLIPAAVGALLFGKTIDLPIFEELKEELSPKSVYLYLMEIYAAQVDATKVDWSGPVMFDNKFSFHK